MKRILVVEDDKAMCNLIRRRLKDQYEVVATVDATEALALALEHKPHCILLDLMLPRLSGLELCQTFSSVSLTQQIPIFVITGQSAAEHETCCLNLGAKEFFEKPLDFARLRARLAAIVNSPRKERRRHPRIQLKMVIKLVGADAQGKEFDLLTATDDVSANGFRCRCTIPLAQKATVQVSLMSREGERRVGRARLVHTLWCDLPWQACGFEFVEKTGTWIV